MIGKFESNKDLIQELTSSGARHVGNIATIITGTVAEVTREIGEWVTDAIEMREAARAAERDREAAAHVNTGRDDPDVLIDEPKQTPHASAAQPYIDADVEIVDPER
ncbi:hypothetical protein IU500_25060 [Nocardia terpenica]|uniref:Uncharacterized protein n=1 Tax=Nocardia terpenica TaxID=455432 RepID=A0A164PIT3_9NOCA|nr:hypothetical protein [Nocardia terpenica]KZM75627.1 hypothetical protein AWN90_19900 [Nocardia terpenica]MBF6064771.1 hypothetical protein [Nocardia terpenica]MBF6107286.1 hypothetical protein [Nocardia terpenica]MBF6115043.1 hypothetical protein [Nocardia terpenica]MBF6122149.1 hypothetical protein [Nocardia terpenica]